MDMLDKNDPVQMKVKNAYDKAIKENLVETMLDERGKQYGKFLEHASITQRLKSIIYAHPSSRNLQPHHLEAIDMIMHKVGRIVNGNPDFKDSWDDIAGYATLVSKIIAGKGM
jgi:hypothetical protein